MSLGCVTLTHFVATAFNSWGRGATPTQAINELRKQVNFYSGGSKRLNANSKAWVELPKTVWGSDQPINVTAGVYLLVEVPKGSTLVEFKY